MRLQSKLGPHTIITLLTMEIAIAIYLASTVGRQVFMLHLPKYYLVLSSLQPCNVGTIITSYQRN